METAVTAGTDEGIWTAPHWYRALSLEERAAAGSISAEIDERAQRRLREWKGQKPFDKRALFADRLKVDALSKEDLLHLLAEPAEALQARMPAPPDWLSALRDAFSDRGAAGRLQPLLERAHVDHALAPCLPALAPVLKRGLKTLGQTVRTLLERYGHLPVDLEMLPACFIGEVAPDILYRLSKPLILELHIARLQDRLRGDTPEARFDDFMRQLAEEGQILLFLSKYPVLARQLLITIDQWAAYLGECLAHLCADWEDIRGTFSPHPGRVIEISAGLGDRHKRGRSVVSLRFDSGLRLLHKPKSLAVDVHFQDLLLWLNERGAEPSLRPMKLIDRGEYGWSEFVTASPCASEDEVRRFYERQGSYLALMYALGGVDLHNENLIAAGEHPMFIDLEALFHPHVHANDPLLTGNPAANAMDQSVWQVGLLPRRLWSDGDSAGVDTSGLGGQAGQMMPHPLARWQGTRTDEMRIGRERIEMPVSENRPALGDRDVDVLDYAEAVVTGFCRVYRLLCRERPALLAEQLPKFAGDAIRAVVRSTNVYGTLLYESFHPDLLRDAIDRDRYFDRLWIEIAERPYLARLVGAERRDLLRGDIPVFTTSPGSHALVDAEGEVIPDFFESTSLDLVRERIERLGEDDLARQVWIVEASLATLLMDREDSMGKPLGFEPATRPPDRDRLLDMAQAAGRRLEALALRNDAGAHWMGVGPLDDIRWGLFPTGTDLYSGTSGIAFFLAYLGAVTGESTYTDLAESALASLSLHIKDLDRYQAATVGAFDGTGSLIYLLTHLGVLWRQPSLLAEAERLVERLPDLIERDDRFDIVYGSAGCILTLLGLQAVYPAPRTLSAAIRCGDRLLAAAHEMPVGIAWTTLKDQLPLGGFSHGTAGIALSLLELAAASKAERFREAAVRALAYDRSLFVPALDNWEDRRVFPNRGGDPTGEGAGRPAAKSMVAWCHGAPGIGLGRIASLDVMDDAVVREEIDIAIGTTERHGFVSNHSLCHGALGNTDLLLKAAQVLDRPQDHEALERATARVVGSIEAHGRVTGVPLGLETPGLMSGLAGIGYELLRLAEPTRIPSVLLLEPPPGEWIR